MSSSSDPSGFVTNPPSTVVKVVNTSRDDANGKLAIVVSYQSDRGRYLVHCVDETQSTMALKPENLVKASMMEQYQAQFSQVKNDARLQRELRTYYDKAKAKLHPVKPEYAGVGLFVLLILCMYFVGFTKTLMVLSIVLMLGVLLGPDVMSGAGWSVVLQNFPMRSRVAIEQSAPFVRGKLSDRMAAGLVVLMLVLAGRTLFASSSNSRTVASTSTSIPAAGAARAMELSPQKYYKLGFDDATGGLEFGTSLESDAAKSAPRALDEGAADDFSDWNEEVMVPPPPRKSSFGFGTAMSGFFLFRTFKELGMDAGTGGDWNYQRALLNLRTLEHWKMAMMAFSAYNVVRAFV